MIGVSSGVEKEEEKGDHVSNKITQSVDLTYEKVFHLSVRCKQTVNREQVLHDARDKRERERVKVFQLRCRCACMCCFIERW